MADTTSIAWRVLHVRSGVTVCAKDALKLSFRFDLGGKDLLCLREPASSRQPVVAAVTGR